MKYPEALNLILLIVEDELNTAADFAEETNNDNLRKFVQDGWEAIQVIRDHANV